MSFQDISIVLFWFKFQRHLYQAAVVALLDSAASFAVADFVWSFVAGCDSSFTAGFVVLLVDCFADVVAVVADSAAACYSSGLGFSADEFLFAALARLLFFVFWHSTYASVVVLIGDSCEGSTTGPFPHFGFHCETV